MGLLNEKLSVPLAEMFLESGAPAFRIEHFESILRSLRRDVPSGELLLKSVSDREQFFLDAHDAGISLDVDKILFPRAAMLAQLLANGGSVNVHTGTPYEAEFIDLLKDLKDKQGFDPSKVTIEVTEHGYIPVHARYSRLEDILSMGFRLAVDDIDPHSEENMERVRAINGAASMHKFSHKTMEQIRLGGEEKGQALEAISALRRDYPKSALVMEGITPKDRALFPALADSGITLVQYYRPHSGPKSAL